MLEVINFIQDGICDLFGTSFFMFVVLLIMKRKNLPRKIIRYQSSTHKSIFNLKKDYKKPQSLGSFNNKYDLFDRIFDCFIICYLDQLQYKQRDS